MIKQIITGTVSASIGAATMKIVDIRKINKIKKELEREKENNSKEDLETEVVCERHDEEGLNKDEFEEKFNRFNEKIIKLERIIDANNDEVEMIKSQLEIVDMHIDKIYKNINMERKAV